MDQRERVIKLSREITLNSKRLIFLLHRYEPSEENLLTDKTLTAARQKIEDIRKLFVQMADEVANTEFLHYRSWRMALEEYVEAVAVYYYFQSNLERVLTMDVFLDEFMPKEVQDRLELTAGDFLAGMADFTGELMRFCINSIGKGKFQVAESVCTCMRKLANEFELLHCQFCINELGRKIQTMRSSVNKCEEAIVQVKMLQSEFPAEMLRELITSRDPSEPNLNE